MKVLAILLCLYLLNSTSVMAADWSSCESELSSAKRNARDAEDYASSLASLEYELESAKGEYDNCLQYPDTFDYYGDGCEYQRYEYNSKVDEYNSEASYFSSELDTLVRRVKNVLSYCG